MKAMKIIGLVCRCIVISLLAVAFLLLLTRTLTTYEEERYAVSSSNYDTIDLDSDWSYDNHNFFERISELQDEGFDITTEILLIVSFGVAIAVVITSFFVKFLRQFYFSVFPLVIVILCIVLTADISDGYILDMEYIGTLYGYKVWDRTTVQYTVNYIPQIIIASNAFLFQCAAGILAFIVSRKEKAIKNEMSYAAENEMACVDENELACVDENAKTETTPQDDTISNIDAITKYNDLLNAGIITQEEFDAKKKQLLGL